MDTFFLVSTILQMLMGASQMNTSESQYLQQQIEQEIQELTNEYASNQAMINGNDDAVFEDQLANASQSPLEFIGSMTKQINKNKNKLLKDNKALQKEDTEINNKLNQLENKPKIYHYGGMWHLHPKPPSICHFLTSMHVNYHKLIGNKEQVKPIARKDISIWLKDMNQKMKSAAKKRLMEEKDVNPMIRSIWKGTKSPISILNLENTGMKNLKEPTAHIKHTAVIKH